MTFFLFPPFFPSPLTSNKSLGMVPLLLLDLFPIGDGRIVLVAPLVFDQYSPQIRNYGDRYFHGFTFRIPSFDPSPISTLYLDTHCQPPVCYQLPQPSNTSSKGTISEPKPPGKNRQIS